MSASPGLKEMMRRHVAAIDKHLPTVDNAEDRKLCMSLRTMFTCVLWAWENEHREGADGEAAKAILQEWKEQCRAAREYLDYVDSLERDG